MVKTSYPQNTVKLAFLIVILLFVFYGISAQNTSAGTVSLPTKSQEEQESAPLQPILPPEKEVQEEQTPQPETKTPKNSTPNESTQPKIKTPITIANWNLQIFGDTKESNPTLMNTYTSILAGYDIMFVQEIRDADGSAFPNLCSKLPAYNCVISSRAGRTSSKEQYGIIYKRDTVTVKNFKDYNPDSLDRWERPPIEVTFDIKGYTLTVYNIHTDPDDVKQELSSLESAVTKQGNVIVLGDLNADCSYYNPAANPEFDSWNWIIFDSEDTTVSATNCAYDRIILNNDAYAEYNSSGIYKDLIDSSVSDHYLVWAQLIIR